MWKTFTSVMVMLFVIFLFSDSSFSARWTPNVPGSNGILDIVEYSGAVGDGIADDSDKVQSALTLCSNTGIVCLIPANKSLLITKELYMWGNMHLVGFDSTSEMLFRTGNKPYIINVGISGVNQLKPKWSGSVRGVTFRAGDNGTGRIFFYWRTEGALISKNTFLLGDSGYGPMSSGNNNNIVVNGNVNCIRKSITIEYNTIHADIPTRHGNEGIGLNQWDGATIRNNTVTGTADDMIGIHFSTNINILDNVLKGTDGRLFVSNSRNVNVLNNSVSRIASPTAGTWFQGISLIYIGHENDATNNFPAPTNIVVRGNKLTYESGAIDIGSAIYVYGPRGVTIDGNTIFNHSLLTTVNGITILPFVYSSGTWTDPDGLDTDNISRVRGVDIRNNNMSAGTFSLPLRELGQTCAYYIGPVTIMNNIGGSFSYICSPTQSNNITL